MSKTPDSSSQPGLSIDIVIESQEWNAIPSAEAVIRRAIEAAWSPRRDHAEVVVLLTDDQSVRTLNGRWRGRDEPTNVLAFPARSAGQDGGAPRMLGDIVVAFGVASREASAEGQSLLHHLAHLAVHGFLHLLGYDHESPAEAETMESLERTILARLGVPDPFAMREVDVVP